MESEKANCSWCRELYPDSEVDAERFSYNAYNWAIGLTMCMFPMVAGINAPVLIINNSDHRAAYISKSERRKAKLSKKAKIGERRKRKAKVNPSPVLYVITYYKLIIFYTAISVLLCKHSLHNNHFLFALRKRNGFGKWMFSNLFVGGGSTLAGIWQVSQEYHIFHHRIMNCATLIMTQRVYCNTGFYGYSLSIYRATGSHTVLGLALLNYAFMAGLLFWRRIFLPRIGTNSNINAVNSQATYRMLRSMFVISVVLIIGWLIGSVLFIRIEGDTSMLTSRIGRELYPDSEVDAERFSYNAYNWAIGLTMCMFPMVAGINAPVLIINNSDNREGYKKMLAPLLKIVCRKHSPPSSVGPLFINQLDHHLHH